MLGFGPLGRYALGELPGIDGIALGAVLELEITIDAGTATGVISEGSALAPGAILPLTVELEPGGASGEQFHPVLAGSGIGRHHRDALAPGALLRLEVSLLPGRVKVSAVARGAVVQLIRTGIEAGTARGLDMVAYDNEFLLLDIAA